MFAVAISDQELRGSAKHAILSLAGMPSFSLDVDDDDDDNDNEMSTATGQYPAAPASLAELMQWAPSGVEVLGMVVGGAGHGRNGARDSVEHRVIILPYPFD